ncbi:hypothetical protein ANN_22515 [Periplaneta americana]|uniref:Uncharacterized protein n=1 Tax=Periplaneta americana TaxID=6978 RepID=A0ABQ8S8C2_PERAM|nr:hypothetical protein ANN_22515 [Periplaneta americana]
MSVFRISELSNLMASRLFVIDGIGDIKMVFDEIKSIIRHGIHLAVGENLGKTQSDNQPKREPNTRLNAALDQIRIR